MCLLIFYKAVVYLKFHLLQSPEVDPRSPLKKQAEAPEFLEVFECLKVTEAVQTTVVHMIITPNFFLPLPAAEVAPTLNSCCDFDLQLWAT